MSVLLKKDQVSYPGELKSREEGISPNRASQLHRFLLTGELPRNVSVFRPFPEFVSPGRFVVGIDVLSLRTFGIDRFEGGKDIYRLGFDISEKLSDEDFYKIPWETFRLKGALRGVDFQYSVVTQLPLGWQMHDLARQYLGQDSPIQLQGIPLLQYRLRAFRK